MVLLRTIVATFALLAAFPQEGAAQPVLLADTNTDARPTWVGSTAHNGEQLLAVAVEEGLPSVVWSVGDTVTNIYSSNADLQISAAPGLFLLQPGFGRTRHLIATDGSPESVEDIGDFGPIARLARVGDRDAWVFWEQSPLGYRLFRTDGTRDETRRITDQGLNSPPEFTAAHGLAYFVREGCDVWRTDGTRAGTELAFSQDNVVDGRQTPCDLKSFVDGQLLVRGTMSGRVWVVAEAGDAPVLAPFLGEVVDVAVGAGGAFIVEDTWVRFTDGTREGTVTVASFPDRPTLTGAVDLGDHMVFVPMGFQVWASDGTPEGTRSLREVAPGIGPVAIEDAAFWLADGFTVFRTQGNSIDILGTLPGDEPARDLARVGDRLVAVNANGIWEIPTSGGTVSLLFPSEDSAPTGNGFPQEFSTVGSTVFFRTNPRRDPRPNLPEPASPEWWRTDATPDGTRPEPQLGQQVRFIGRLDARRSLIEVGPNQYGTITEAGPVDFQLLRDEREFTEEEMNVIVTNDLIASDGNAYIVNMVGGAVGASVYYDLVVSTVGQSLRSVSRIRFFQGGEFETHKAWIGEGGDLVITTPSCRTWTIEPDGKTTFERTDLCSKSTPLVFPGGQLERAHDDTAWLVDDRGRIRLGETDVDPVKLDDLGYFINTATNGPPQLFVTDGTTARSMPVDIGEDYRLYPGFLEVHRGVLYLISTSPSALLAYLPGEGIEVITPTSGSGRLHEFPRFPGFTGLAFVDDRVVYSGVHDLFGIEPFQTRVPTRGPDEFGPVYTPPGQLTGSGCACTQSPVEEPPLWVLLLLAAATGVRLNPRRRASP